MGASKRYGDAKPARRAIYVTVYRDVRAYPGLFLEWRKERDSSGYTRWWAKVIYIDGDRLLHEYWFPAARVKPAPYAEHDESY